VRATRDAWCPRHDRVFPVADLHCPECGTPLVLLEAPAPRRPVATPALVPAPAGLEEAAPEAPAPATRRFGAGPRAIDSVLTLVALAAVTAGGLAALTSRAPRTTSGARVVRDHGVALELVRTQRTGARLAAAFRVRDGINPADIKQADIELVTDLGETLPLRPPTMRTGDGFSIVAELPDRFRRIRTISVTGLDLSVDDAPSWTADISGWWPVPEGEDRSVEISQARDVGEGSVTLRTIAGSRGTIRTTFDTSGLNVGGTLRYTFGGYELEWHARKASARTVESRARLSFVGLTVEFDGIPDDVRSVRVRLSDGVRFVEGSWSWRLPVRLEGVQPGAEPSIIPTCYGSGPSRVCGLTVL
jgi:hypothetical protein